MSALGRYIVDAVVLERRSPTVDRLEPLRRGNHFGTPATRAAPTAWIGWWMFTEY